MLDGQGKQAESESALDLWRQLRHQLMSSQGMCPSRHTLHRGAAGGQASATDGWET